MTSLEFVEPFKRLKAVYKIIGPEAEWFKIFKSYHTLDVDEGVTELMKEDDSPSVKPAHLVPFVRDARTRRVGLVMRKDELPEDKPWGQIVTENNIPMDVTKEDWDGMWVRLWYAASKLLLAKGEKPWDYETFIIEGRPVVGTELGQPVPNRSLWLMEFENKEVKRILAMVAARKKNV